MERLQASWLDAAGLTVLVLRLDCIDPLVSGNKWYKLTPYLAEARETGAAGLLSVGGPHSNHLHALAAAGQRSGLATVGLLRGHPQETPTTVDLQRFGMRLHWLGYGAFRARYTSDFWVDWQARYPGFLTVPEGGGGLRGAMGCVPLVRQVQAALPALGCDDFDAWWLAAGTGSTLAGIVIGEQGRRTVYGALAGPLRHGVKEQVDELLEQAGASGARFQLVEAARGGFGRCDDELRAFIRNSEQESGMPLDPVYTGKALMALRDQARAGRLARGTRLVFVHTGGLQGRRAAGL